MSVTHSPFLGPAAREKNQRENFNFGNHWRSSFTVSNTRAKIVSFDGNTVVTERDNGSSYISWNANTGTALAVFRNDDGVWTSFTISADRQAIVTGTRRGACLLSDITTGALLASLGGNEMWVDAVAMSPDGTLIATASGFYVTICDVATRAIMHKLEYIGGIQDLVFSPDGTKLAAGTGLDNNMGLLWDIETGARIATLPGHTANVCTVAFSPDGTKLATGSHDHTAKLWDVTTHELISTYSNTAAEIWSVLFNTNGSTLATVSHHVVELWNVQTNVLTATIAGKFPAFSPNGNTIATVSDAGTLHFRNVATNVLWATLAGRIAIYSFAFSPDGITIATGSADGTVKLWDLPDVS